MNYYKNFKQKNIKMIQLEKLKLVIVMVMIKGDKDAASENKQ